MSMSLLPKQNMAEEVSMLSGGHTLLYGSREDCAAKSKTYAAGDPFCAPDMTRVCGVGGPVVVAVDNDMGDVPKECAGGER